VARNCPPAGAAHSGSIRRTFARDGRRPCARGSAAGKDQGNPYGADHLASPDVGGTAALLHRLGIKGEFLLSVGTAEPRKKIGRLLAAYRIARLQLPEPWPFLLGGPSGARNESLSIDPVGVHRLGKLDSGILAGLYAKARLFAYVPLMEGFGFPPERLCTAERRSL
jgi:glycosyltransferase involved in cell wall biosynthesis